MIGDVLATSILFEAIKNKYPSAQLHYVINTHTYAVVKENPFIDKFYFFTPEHENSKRKLWQFANQLRKEKYDVVIDVYAQLSSKIIASRSKAATRISINKDYNALIYNHRFKNKMVPKTNAGLAIENRLQLLQPLGIDTTNIIKPKIYLSDSEKDLAKQFLTSNGIDLDKPLFMIGVLGSGKNKTYPFEYMAKVLDTIATKKPNCQMLFNYIPKQEAEAKSILNLCRPNTRSRIFFELFGSNLRDFLAITSHCDALIGNEGGAINMAKALNIPTFTIFSPWIKKEAWNMFDDGTKHLSVHLKDYRSDVYTNIRHPKTLKPLTPKLYKEFKPSLFIEALQSFLSPFN